MNLEVETHCIEFTLLFIAICSWITLVYILYSTAKFNEQNNIDKQM